MFPFQAKLISEPDSEYAREHMQVGETYTVFAEAGSCYEVSTDISGDKTMIWRGRLEIVLH
jgi:hypothetical protein